MVAIAFSLVLLAVGSADASNSRIVRGTIVEKSERPPPSGVISTWVEISVEVEVGATIKVFIPYMSETQRLPNVGETCDFIYQIKNIDGAVGLKISQIQDAKVVGHFVCQGKDQALGSKKPSRSEMTNGGSSR
jgi:hypothetical protein